MQVNSSAPARLRPLTTQEIDDGWTLPAAVTGAGARERLVPPGGAPANSLPLAAAAVAPTAPPPAGASREPSVAPPVDGAADARTNLNTAALEQLCTLPGIGVRKAKAIIAYRQRRGPISSVVELDSLHGFGPMLIERLSELCRV